MNLSRKFKRAARGLAELGRETSIKIEILVGLIALVLGSSLNLSRTEWLALLGVVFGVIILEGLNTVLERTVDLAEPRYHEAVRTLKDITAGLVLLAAAAAVVLGVIIFWPHL